MILKVTLAAGAELLGVDVETGTLYIKPVENGDAVWLLTRKAETMADFHDNPNLKYAFVSVSAHGAMELERTET